MNNYTNNIVYSTLNVKCYSAVCWLVDKSGAVIITLYTACQSAVHPSPDMRRAVTDKQTQDVDPSCFNVVPLFSKSARNKTTLGQWLMFTR